MKETANIPPRSVAMLVFLTLALTQLAALAAEPKQILGEPRANETAIVFETMDGEKVDAFEGKIQVPENRGNPNSRLIPVHYVRFPATTAEPGPPIIYLAGGPGGSGILTAQYPRFRFPLFMALREHGDVIALDQRGTGASSTLPKCVSGISLPWAEPFTDAEVTHLHRVAAQECVGFWQGKGIDVFGYNTVESAKDIDDLRAHLGAQRVTLWGISYGSHLALASLKVMGNHIHKMVIASAEGLDQTVKMPHSTDAYFDRLQIAIDTQQDAAALYPDVSALIRRVHKRLELNPIRLQIPAEQGATTEFLFQRFHMQVLASSMIADPHRGVTQLLALYQEIDQAGSSDEVKEAVAALVVRAGFIDRQISFDLMPFAMDVASGITSKRLQQVKLEAQTSLLGLALNFPMPQLADLFPELDLGDEFRVFPRSSVPTLLLTGTLDGRTYIEEQQEATRGLTNLTHVMVANAGHNLFMVSPDVTETIHKFLRDDKIDKDDIVIALPKFAM